MASNSIFARWWRQLCFDIPRIFKNAQSRRRVSIIIFSIAIGTVICAIIYGSIGLFEYRFGGGWGGVAFVLIMYALAFTFRLGMKKTGQSVTLSLSSTPKPSLRSQLLGQQKAFAVLVNRAAFEVGLANAKIERYTPGATRAALMQKLRSNGVWESLPLPVRNLLASSEGSWSSEQTGRALLHFEAINVLSWVLREDFSLSALRVAMTVDADTLKSALEDTHAAREINYLRSFSEVDAERNPTLVYLVRLRNELVKRGAAEGEIDEELNKNTEGIMAYYASIGDADVVSEDMPIGGQLISEANTEDLLRLRGVAAVRIVMLEALLDAISKEDLSKLNQALVNAC